MQERFAMMKLSERHDKLLGSSNASDDNITLFLPYYLH